MFLPTCSVTDLTCARCRLSITTLSGRRILISISDSESIKKSGVDLFSLAQRRSVCSAAGFSRRGIFVSSGWWCRYDATSLLYVPTAAVFSYCPVIYKNCCDDKGYAELIAWSENVLMTMGYVLWHVQMATLPVFRPCSV